MRRAESARHAVITCHITGTLLGTARASAMLRYLRNHQQEDGGWGTHIDMASTMFGTVLNYVTARILADELGVVPASGGAAKLASGTNDHSSSCA